MTQHDTPEAVEAMAASISARVCEVYAGHGHVMELPDTDLMEAAAMLRRLHQRAVDAERALATARADAMREAAGQCAAMANALHPSQVITDRCAAVILALIPQPTTTGET